MSFTWDWLLTTMITTGITDYYQVNVCDNHNDIVLYKLGRVKGPILTEVHIIHRTSLSCYRVTSFDYDCCLYKSCKNVTEVCNYIREVFIPESFRLPTVHERLLQKRKRRYELYMDEVNRNKIGSIAGENINTLENTIGYEEYFRKKVFRK